MLYLRLFGLVAILSMAWIQTLAVRTPCAFTDRNKHDIHPHVSMILVYLHSHAWCQPEIERTLDAQLCRLYFRQSAIDIIFSSILSHVHTYPGILRILTLQAV